MLPTIGHPVTPARQPWKGYRLPLAGIVAYATLSAMMLWVQAPLAYLAHHVPASVMFCLYLLLGPPLLLLWGPRAFGTFAWATLLVAIPLLFGWIAERRSHESEKFVIGIVIAALVWLACSFLAIVTV
jgi:hypothetical protein